MSVGKQVPEIRFKGFSGEWQNKELKGICSYHASSLTVNDAQENGLFKLYDAKKCIGYTDTFGQGTDYITIVKDGAGVGRVRLLPKQSNFIATMGALKPDGSDLAFLYCCLMKVDFTKHISGGTIPHIYFKDYGNDAIKVPSLVEQAAIGNYFQKLDNLINQHQQKHDKFRSIKKAMLEKMFPKEGETVPEIRFKGFSGEWKRNKLEECFKERVERCSEGELLSVTINSGIKKFSELGRRDNSSDDKSNYKKVEAGDIAYNSMRMWQGASGCSPYRGILSPAYTVIIPKDNIDSLFFSFLIKKPEVIQVFQNRSQGITSDTWNLKFPAFGKIEIMRPDIAEQTQIGNYFQKLDILIIYHQQQITKLNNIKQACLSKMFV